MPIHALSLTHSWAISDAAQHVPVGALLSAPGEDEAQTCAIEPATMPDVGLWRCDLHDERLTWTPSVYALFGLPREEALRRSLIVSLYEEPSRAAMEQLRAHAIRHRRGFTLDALIRRPDGDRRWMRLCALPIIEDRKVVRLCGTKKDVTAEYDGTG